MNGKKNESVLKETRSSALLFGILFVSALLRMHDLNRRAVLDEPLSIYVAKLDPPQIVSHTASGVHPPLYYFVLHYWIVLFGDSEIATRVPSVIFSVCALIVLYRIGERLFSREVGLVSALIAGLSVFQIRLAQYARMYSLLALLALLSMYFFIRLKESRTLAASLGYVGFTIALLYTHSYGLFIVIAQNLYVFSLSLILRDRAFSLKKWFTLQLLLMLLFVPWLTVLPRQVSNTEAYEWIATPTVLTLVRNFTAYAGSTPLFLIFLCATGFAFLTCIKIQGEFNWTTAFESIARYRWIVGIAIDNKVYLLLVWLLVPNVLPFVYSRFSRPIYGEDRFTIVASVALYVLTAKGIGSIELRLPKLGVIAIIAVLSLRSVAGYYITPKTDTPYRAVAQYVDEHAQAGDLILFVNRPTKDFITHIDLGFDAYSKRRDLTKISFPSAFYDLSHEEAADTLNATVHSHRRVWMFMTKPEWDYLRNESVLHSAKARCQTFEDSKVCLFELRAT